VLLTFDLLIVPTLYTAFQTATK